MYTGKKNWNCIKYRNGENQKFQESTTTARNLEIRKQFLSFKVLPCFSMVFHIYAFGHLSVVEVGADQTGGGAVLG